MMGLNWRLGGYWGVFKHDHLMGTGHYSICLNEGVYPNFNITFRRFRPVFIYICLGLNMRWELWHKGTHG